MDSEELLAQLADIHLPEPVSSFPPAPGWWLLALLLLIGAVVAYRKFSIVNRQRKFRENALAELEQCFQAFASPQSHGEDLGVLKLQFVNSFNSVLRRVALWHFPQDNVASLAGDDWIAFLQEHGSGDELSEEMIYALSKGRFQTSMEVDVERLYQYGQHWISTLYMKNPEGLAGANNA